MMFEVPLAYPRVYQGSWFDPGYAGAGLRGFRGVSGLGQICTDPETGDAVDCGSTSPSAPSTPPIVIPPMPPVTGPVGGSVNSCPSGEYLDPSSGLCLLSPSSPGSSTSTPTTPSSSLTTAQLAALISSSGSAASSVIKATSSPYVIPGTNVLYNPATGQIVGASGLTSSTLDASLSGIMPLLLLALAAFAVIEMGKK
jgi:hypothetical protein